MFFDPFDYTDHSQDHANGLDYYDHDNFFHNFSHEANGYLHTLDSVHYIQLGDNYYQVEHNITHNNI